MTECRAPREQQAPHTMGKLLVLAVLGATLALVGERLLAFSGKITSSRQVESVEPQSCHLIEGLGIKISRHANIAPDEPGKIFLMDLNEQNPKAQVLEISDGFDKESFNPHGISTFIDKDHTVYLYVVNHPHMKSTVEIFKFEEQQRSLKHLKTIAHELLKRVSGKLDKSVLQIAQEKENSLIDLTYLTGRFVNDIVVLGPEQFYATRDHYFTSFFLSFLEMILDLHWTYVLFYSPREVKIVAKGFSSANGITASLDQKYVYVADVTARNIHITEKHDNWDLTELKVMHLDTLVDNLTVDPDTGDILAGCHPNGMKLLMYNPEDPPGSEVLRIQNALSDKPRVSTVYANNGSVLQGSTVASVYRGKMLIGTVFHRALYCVL